VLTRTDVSLGTYIHTYTHTDRTDHSPIICDVFRPTDRVKTLWDAVRRIILANRHAYGIHQRISQDSKNRHTLEQKLLSAALTVFADRYNAPHDRYLGLDLV